MPSRWERFYAKTRLGPGDCVTWVGARSRGYGQVSVDGQIRPAHRVAYEWWRGPVPAELDLDHLCRNRACVNPSHLEPVTRRENLLRGNTVTARNTAATHCPAGHPYSGENMRLDRRGWRVCRSCDRERARA